MRLDTNIPFDLAHGERPAMHDAEEVPPQSKEDIDKEKQENEEMQNYDPDPGATSRDPPQAQDRPAKRQRTPKPNGTL